MATSGLDMYRQLGIALGNETASPSSLPLPATNTVSAKRSNNSDKVGASNRSYRIWRDNVAPATGGGYELTLFLSSTDGVDTLPVIAGQQWTTPASMALSS